MCSHLLRLRGVTGGVVAGDMNTIIPEDEGTEMEVGLRDTWRKGSAADRGKTRTWGV
jgi:hypothetical protein